MNKEFLKKNKYWITGIALTGAFAILFALAQIPEAKAAQEKEDAQAEVTAQVNAITEDVNALYTDESKTMLAEGVTLEQVTEIEEGMTALEGNENFTNESGAMLNESITELGYAKSMIELRDMANALFNEDGTVKDDADIQAVQVKADELKQFKPEYVATIQVQIEDANAQVAETKAQEQAEAEAQAQEEAKAQAEAQSEEQAEEEEYVSSDSSNSSTPSSADSDSSSSSSDSNSSSSSSSDSNSSSSSSSDSNSSSSSSSDSNSDSSDSSESDGLQPGDSWTLEDTDGEMSDNGNGSWTGDYEEATPNQ